MICHISACSPTIPFATRMVWRLMRGVMRQETLVAKIVSTPDVINANPRIDGTRLSVLDVVDACSSIGIKKVLENCPELTEEDVNEAIRFCASRECFNLKQHCGGCTLRLKQDHINSAKDFVNRFSEVYFEDSKEIISGSGTGVIMMPGDASTLEKYWRGLEGWKIATDLQK